MKVQSGPEGQTTLLTSRIVIQPCMSSIEGRVVDDKGKPIANLKIIAEQVKPIKGYERFEATTDSDGTFSFGKLFPASEYTFSPWFDDWSLAPQRTLKCAANKVTARFNKEGWTTEDRMKVQSVPEGETIILKIVILPTVSIFDGKLVDGKHKPMANVKIVAKQKHPVVRGYGYFEAETGLDGTFSFKKLFPTSEYTLIPISELWKTNVQKVITTTGEQETLKGELTVRFIIAKGVVAISTQDSSGRQKTMAEILTGKTPAHIARIIEVVIILTGGCLQHLNLKVCIRQGYALKAMLSLI